MSHADTKLYYIFRLKFILFCIPVVLNVYRAISMHEKYILRYFTLKLIKLTKVWLSPRNPSGFNFFLRDLRFVRIYLISFCYFLQFFLKPNFLGFSEFFLSDLQIQFLLADRQALFSELQNESSDFFVVVNASIFHLAPLLSLRVFEAWNSQKKVVATKEKSWWDYSCWLLEDKREMRQF